jgi:FKBP-type peptidyl-prolyl cis-trans isomerase FklB
MAEDAKKAAPATAAAAFASDKEKASYAIGLVLAQRIVNQQVEMMKKQGVDIDKSAFNTGLKDAIDGAKPRLSEQEVQAAIDGEQKKLVKRRDDVGAKNMDTGKKFLADNKKKEGVKETASGLQYQVITEGKGKKPTPEDTVVANYRGTLIDGREFDSSYKRGEPASFQVKQVIKGWQEALPMMTVGSKWKIFVPADLAYGATPPPGSEIGPNDALIFEIELVDVKQGQG